MKKALTPAFLAAALGSTLLLGQGIAQADTMTSGPAGQYLTAQMAVSESNYYSGLSNGLSFVGTYGVPIPQVHPYFGVEGELTKSVVDPDYNWAGYHFKYDYISMGGYGVMTFPLNDKFSIRGRAGLVVTRWKFSNDFTGDTSGTDVNLSAGGGMIYKFASNMNLIAEATFLSSDITHLSAGVQFKF